MEPKWLQNSIKKSEVFLIDFGPILGGFGELFGRQNMIKNRNKYYAKAQNKIDCHNKTKKEIVDRILDII